MDLMDKAKRLKAEGLDIIDLSGGEPDFDTPQMVKDKVIEEISKGNTHYAVGKGILKLRERIQRKLLEENQMDVLADDIIVTPGAKMAIYLAVRACINTGDEVIVPTPSWVSYQEIVKASGGVPIPVELREEDNYLLRRELLEDVYTSKTKMIIINSPNNPTGRVLSDSEIVVLKEFATEKNIYILSDEIYEKIIFNDRINYSLAADNELKERTITVNGLSKSYAMTGWRVGYLTAPHEIISTIYKLYTHTVTGLSPFIQEAAVVAFDCNEDVEKMCKQYESRRKLFVDGLNKISGVKSCYPEGAFYVWVKFEFGNMNANDIADYLLDTTGVVGVPGGAYGETKNSHIRFSFAKSTGELREALCRISEACTIMNG